VVSSTPQPHFTAGKDPVPILQDAGWAPGPVWTGGKSRPYQDSIPDRPARSQSLYRLVYTLYVQVVGFVLGTVIFHRMYITTFTSSYMGVELGLPQLGRNTC